MCTDCRTPGLPDIWLRRASGQYVFEPRSERGDTFLAGVFQDLREQGLLEQDLSNAMVHEIVAWAQHQGLVVFTPSF